MFSNKLSDLDDFLAPAQDCVVQLQQDKDMVENKASLKIELESDWRDPDEGSDVRPDLIKKNQKNVAKISLTDCLACSGCVTTAETMLIQQHSIDKVEELLKNVDKEPCVVSVSQQSLYSLCALYETEPKLLFKVINKVLGTFGVSKVYDFSLSTQFILNESYNEFLERYKNSEKYQKVKECLEILKSKPGKEEGKTTPEREEELKSMKKMLTKQPSTPVLCSECPGWVCYAEKVVGDVSIPFMSEIKSPQQIQGNLIKTQANRKLFQADPDQEAPEKVVHICVMPCYDKKLEAVRPAGVINNINDIADEKLGVEVDAVIATHELADLFQKRGIDIKQLLEEEKKEESKIIQNFEKDICELDREITESPFYSGYVQKQSSNGYSEYIFIRAAKELYGVDLTSDDLAYKQVRNKDFQEVVLEVMGLPVMKFALAYGFRNIQNIVRNIKRKKSVYDYVEIMACPGGCLNGGGQIKPKDLGLTPIELLHNLIEIQKQSLELIDLENVPGMISLYHDIDSEQVKEMIKTEFTPIKTEASVANLKW
ncbi:unnamed protein product [Moneuplotes crassus]|uniref:Iron hydrogenase large subunit C-terminal domain-containing protein n=2 Tax=Euplotes crassus TaxID=5936 RepID=A0AAD1X729_EUPCR|nr:unnamed protein product [Moneuplotes crassus]